MASSAGSRQIDIIPDFGFTLSDGTRLSARIWMPKDAASSPVPAILEYLPYRKSDGTALRDETMHPAFAAHGYACVRVDRRGSGDSEGLFDDEYSVQELDDGVEIINQIAAQPWCSGNVGIQGSSWGGVNGRQLAARAPEPLKAVITIGSTVDRYTDDIHYKGGQQLGENIGWAATYTSWSSLPPDPRIVGARWREMLLERMENMPFMAKTWLEHPNRDAYWKHGSVNESYGTIKAAVLALGGLHDGYTNAMAHLVENLDAPVQGIAGPWNHKYPHITNIGPSLDYISLALRWWDRWLKGVENGADADSAYRAYIMESCPPDPGLTHRAGHWVAKQVWPSPEIKTLSLQMTDNGLVDPSVDTAGARFHRTVPVDLLCGEDCGEFFPFGFGPGELPDDQTADDRMSACFDSAALEDDLDILGAPLVDITVASDQPDGQIVVRLCDLRPEGTSNLVSLGMLNLRHRESFETPRDLTPGETYTVRVTLDQTAYRIPRGHSLRVAVSSSYWPFAWPEGKLVTLGLSGGALHLPIRLGKHEEPTDWVGFNPAPPTPDPAVRVMRNGREEKQQSIEPFSGVRSLRFLGYHGQRELTERGLSLYSAVEEVWTLDPKDPTSATVRIEWNRGLAGDGWSVRTRFDTRMTCDETHYHVEHLLSAEEVGKPVFERQFKCSVPRK